MNHFRFPRLVLAVGVLAGLAVGCSGPDQRFAVKGKVSLDGEPVSFGSVTLLPLENQKFNSGGNVEGGQFDIPTKLGPNKGKYRVEFRWPKPTGKKMKNPDTGEVMDVTHEAFPAKYNTESTLTADIPSSEELTFDLKSK